MDRYFKYKSGANQTKISNELNSLVFKIQIIFGWNTLFEKLVIKQMYYKVNMLIFPNRKYQTPKGDGGKARVSVSGEFSSIFAFN